MFRIESTRSPWGTDDLIREELFSIERLEEHATSLARAQAVAVKPRARRSLNARLRDNEKVLLAAYRSIGAAAAGITRSRRPRNG